MSEPLLSVKNMKKTFQANGGMFSKKKFVHAVNDVSFDIYPGETFSLVGESGCGKSTTGKLIDHLITPDTGEIWLEGKDISKISDNEMRPLRSDIQMVFQDPAASLNERATVDYIVSEGLYNFHLYENEADRVKKVENMINEVGLLPEHLTRYPHEFSGGQRQRLCIARALLKKPKILILDDSTSAVDTKTDKLIRSAFHNEIPDTTKIIIAQRVASVQESDMILVMDSGRIMASGTHDELLATCDEYRSIYESQTKNQAQPEELAAAEQAAESSTAEPSETVTVTVTMPTADTSAADANAADTKEGEAR